MRSDVSEIEKEFEILKSFLMSQGKLTDDEIKIYVLGMKKGILTSSAVTENIQKIRQNTAGGILKRLSNKGFFSHLPDSESSRKGGRGRSKKYKVIPPTSALKSIIDEHKRITTVIEKMDEHLELYSNQHKDDDEEIWIIKPENTAAGMIARNIRNAEESVKIYSHDCTWATIKEVKDALKNIQSRKIPLQVAGTNPGKKEKRIFSQLSIKTKNTKIHGTPFILIDNEILMMPYKCGRLGSNYRLMETRNSYLVKNFTALFENIYHNGDGDKK